MGFDCPNERKSPVVISKVENPDPPLLASPKAQAWSVMQISSVRCKRSYVLDEGGEGNGS